MGCIHVQFPKFAPCERTFGKVHSAWELKQGRLDELPVRLPVHRRAQHVKDVDCPQRLTGLFRQTIQPHETAYVHLANPYASFTRPIQSRHAEPDPGFERLVRTEQALLHRDPARPGIAERNPYVIQADGITNPERIPEQPSFSEMRFDVGGE